MCTVCVAAVEDNNCTVQGCAMNEIFSRYRLDIFFFVGLGYLYDAYAGHVGPTLQGVSKSCAPFVWLLWRSNCTVYCLACKQLQRICFDLEFETSFELI